MCGCEKSRREKSFVGTRVPHVAHGWVGGCAKKVKGVEEARMQAWRLSTFAVITAIAVYCHVIIK